MNGWYDNAYDKAPTLSISIQIARTKNIRLYCGQQRGTANPVSCDIAPLRRLGTAADASCLDAKMAVIFLSNLEASAHDKIF